MKKTAKKKSDSAAKAPADGKGAINASAKVLQIGAGLYLLSVRSGVPRAAAPGLRLPALHVSTVPGTPAGRVEFVPNVSANATWLSSPGDLLVVKVHAPGAALVLSSMRAAGGSELAIKFERLDGSDRPTTAAATTAPLPAAERRGPADGLRVHVGAHIRGRGDMNFTDALWAGKVGKGFWLESYSITPQEEIAARDVEYKGLTASGFESPWMSDGASCGTRGMAIPLIGFAIRPKGNATNAYDVEYSGYFQSGVVVGPLRNGTPCRSTVPNDPLEGLQVKIFKRGAKAKAPAGKRSRR